MSHVKGWKASISVAVKYGRWKSQNHHVDQGERRNKGFKPFKNKVLRRAST